jgi:hypothetical protein
MLGKSCPDFPQPSANPERTGTTDDEQPNDAATGIIDPAGKKLGR